MTFVVPVLGSKSDKYLIALALLISSLISCTDKPDENLSVDLLPILSSSNSPQEFVDVSGKPKFTCQNESGEPCTESSIYREGLALVKINGLWEFLSQDGSVAIKGAGEKAESIQSSTVFSEGVAWVVFENSPPAAINTTGKVLFSLEGARYVRIFKEGLAAFKQTDSLTNGWGFVDSKGQIKITPQFRFANNFSNGLCAVKSHSGKWGYINQEGKLIINYQFEKAYDFHNDHAIVESNHKYGLIDRTGAFVINPIYSNLMHDGQYVLAKSGDKWGWFEPSGKAWINPQFEQAFPFNGQDKAAIRMEKKWGYIDQSGKIIINPQFDKAWPFTGKFAVVYDKAKRRYGMIDESGRLNGEPSWSKVSGDYLSYALNKGTSYEVVSSNSTNLVAVVNQVNKVHRAFRHFDVAYGDPNFATIGDIVELLKENELLNDTSVSIRRTSIMPAVFSLLKGYQLTNDITLDIEVDGFEGASVMKTKIYGYNLRINLLNGKESMSTEIVNSLKKSLDSFNFDEYQGVYYQGNKSYFVIYSDYFKCVMYSIGSYSEEVGD